METTNIYALIDPRTDHVRYIGKANVVYKRHFAHINDKRINHRTCWIKGLKNEGLKPTVEIIDVVNKNEWQFWEKHYISLFKSWGFDLTNRSEGGEGTEHTAETRKRMSESKKGKDIPHLSATRNSEENKNRLRGLMVGVKQSPELIERRMKNVKKPILQFSLAGEFIKEWESQAEAIRQLNCWSIQYNLKGVTTHCKGFVFKYKNI